ncbi:hypothetical protein RHSIM_Rhsim02G0064300 [Rhododendron simsii]|uniref:Uncharacterized protein n=1 Tax=Rhododendron simsii TaxID=118357 RepID=A0A834HD57_RHOSS|nr:hypothetical protein RHSIM_Rhsim02G0064300 [Rhododendron simsii]
MGFLLLLQSSILHDLTQNLRIHRHPKSSKTQTIKRESSPNQIRSNSEVGKEDEAEVDCSVSVPNCRLREIEAGNGEFFLIEHYRDYNGIEEKGEDSLNSEGNKVLGLRKLVAEVVALFL